MVFLQWQSYLVDALTAEKKKKKKGLSNALYTTKIAVGIN